MNENAGFDITPKAAVTRSKRDAAIRQGSLATMMGRLDQVHALTYIDFKTQGHLLSPFIKHYTDLGIASRRISLAMGVDAVTPEMRKIALDLKACGIRAPKLVPRNLDDEDRANVLLQVQKKYTLASEWILRAEIDELLQLPLPLAQLLNMMENREFDWLAHHGTGRVILHTTSLTFGADLTTPDLETSATLAVRHLKSKGFDGERETNRKAARMQRIASQAPNRMPYPGGGKTVVSGKANRAVPSEGWTIRQLTQGCFGDPWHAHSYFDIPVIDSTSSWIAAHRSDLPYRPVERADKATIGRISIADGGFEPLAETVAWSWQQGPMAQWTQTGDLLWNDRDGDTLVGRRLKGGTAGKPETFDRPIYALTPDGTGYLSVCWARLARFRPAYGYEGGTEASAGQPAPNDDGVWHVDFATGTSRLVLSLAQGVECLFNALPEADVAALRAGEYSYWFNHVKISPDGKRFTVKLRYKTPDTQFQGVSLTCGVDGSDVRLLGRRTSHVIWLDSTSLFWWSMADKEVMMGDDVPMGQAAPVPFAKGAFTKNPHAQVQPNTNAQQIIFDVPYRRTVLLKSLDRATGETKSMAQFGGHMPEAGTYRCDLHPVPLPNGQGAVVTSLASGSRQVFVVERV